MAMESADVAPPANVDQRGQVSTTNHSAGGSVTATGASRGSFRGRGSLRVGFLAFGLVYPTIRLLIVLTGSMDRVRQDFADDAYYYALVAHNIATGEGSTFGGMVPTNGYQPLWQLLLVPIAALSSGDAQVRLTFTLAAIFFACFVYLAWRFSTRLGTGTESLYAIVYSGTIGTLFGNQFFSGMEYALVVPAAMMVLLILLRGTQQFGQEISKPNRCGALLGLSVLVLALSRLDALALPVAYALVTLPRQRERGVLRAWIVAAIVVAAGLITYAAINLVRYGTPVPISGLAKALGGGTLASAAALARNYAEFGGIGPATPMWLGLQGIIISVVALWLLHRGRATGRQHFSERHDTALSYIIQALILGQLVQLSYYAATSSWHLWEWYYYYIPLQLLVAGLVVVRATLRARWFKVLRNPMIAAAIAVLAAAAGLGLFIRDYPETTWTTSNVGVGAWISRNTPQDAVIAMGDRAGGVLWASNRRTVQLEGLVEDPNYLSVLRSHTIPQHLIDQSVDYYVRGSTVGDAAGSAPVAGSAGCWSFAEPGQGQGPKSSVVVCDTDRVFSSVQDDGSLWQIWTFRPDLQGH